MVTIVEHLAHIKDASLFVQFERVCKFESQNSALNQYAPMLIEAAEKAYAGAFTKIESHACVVH